VTGGGTASRFAPEDGSMSTTLTPRRTGSRAARRAARLLVALWTAAVPVAGQSRSLPGDGRASASGSSGTDGVVADSAAPHFLSRADSLAWAFARDRAARARGFRLVVSLSERRLWAIVGVDTVMTASIAIGTDSVLAYQGKRWRFRTPRGVHTVARKDSLPVWIPPEWHYYEVARQRGLAVAPLSRGRPVALDDRGRLEVRGDVVGVAGPDASFEALPADEEIIADGVLYIPPLGTRNRRIAGELGRYRLDLGEGYMLHGTPREESIGRAATHGCIRLREDDIAWLYEFVRIGTRVYIY
jgi:hypothetical protein